MRNTQQQYARIELQPSCEIWSVVVKGQAVKPARDKETNALMVPLEKGGKGSGENKHAAFTVCVRRCGVMRRVSDGRSRLCGWTRLGRARTRGRWRRAETLIWCFPRSICR